METLEPNSEIFQNILNAISMKSFIVGLTSDQNLQIFLIGKNFKILHLNVLIFITFAEAHFLAKKGPWASFKLTPILTRNPDWPILKFYKNGNIVYRWKVILSW